MPKRKTSQPDASPSKPAKTSAFKTAHPGRGGHKRTEATARVVAAMASMPGVTLEKMAEALGIGLDALRKHYRDLIPESGPGRKPAVRDENVAKLIRQYRASGLREVDIRGILRMDKAVLYALYGEEMRIGKAEVIGAIGSNVIVTALGKGPDSFKAQQFYLSTQGKWATNSKLGVSRDQDEEGPLVSGRQITRADARRVAYLLSKAARQIPQQAHVVADEPDDGASR